MIEFAKKINEGHKTTTLQVREDQIHCCKTKPIIQAQHISIHVITITVSAKLEQV